MNTENYLEKFGDIKNLDRDVLLNEMDDVWDQFKLDNNKKLSSQEVAVSNFYSHPVWVLNGLFSELDPISKGHRVAIARFLKTLPALSNIADYGGGSGVLAKIISEHLPDAGVEIVEPYPNEYFVAKIGYSSRINFVSTLNKKYDVVIAQDVLEHVDEPIELALKLIDSVKDNGYLIFANCFYPDIKCHLPATFYLRHHFSNVVRYAGLSYVTRIPNCTHALVFRKTGAVRYSALNLAVAFAKLTGPILNTLSSSLRFLRDRFKK